VLCASNNRKKVEELRSILGGLTGARVLTPRELDIELEVEETGSTFAENAIIKADAFARVAGTCIVVADDSGLVVDALGGEPGIYSARYAGPGASDEDRSALVLARLEGVPSEQRTARFVCAIAVAGGGLPTAVREGVVEGEIAREPRGSGGFGYDPIFCYPPLGRTFGELDGETKARVSHRGRALRLAAPLIVAQTMDGILD
jgi:XTP/dITP diphosphohydrolase